MSAIQDAHPFLFVPWYSSRPLSPVLGLTLALPEDMQGLLRGCSPWGAQGLYLAPDNQPSSARCSAFNAQQLHRNPSSVLGKMHCWRFWENYFPLPLQRKVLRLQCNSTSMCVAQSNHLSPYPCRTRDQVQARPQQREKHLCAKLSVASPPPLQLYCPSLMQMLRNVLHILFISYCLTDKHINSGHAKSCPWVPLVMHGTCFFPQFA